MPPKPHRIVIVGLAPAQMLDITGPLDAFAVANDACLDMGKPQPYELLLAAPTAGKLQTTSGISLHADYSIFDTQLAADTLLIAGGRGARAAANDTQLTDALAKLCQRAGRVGSICTGAFPLAATGALDGRRATTHWAHFDEFAEKFPSAHIDRDALFVHDGKFHTSAGITAGIDFALALIENDLDCELARKVARELVMFMKRPGGQSQFSTRLTHEATGTDRERYAKLVHWMSTHLCEDLSVEALADRQAMSPRNFARRFTEALKVTPGKFVQALRVDEARRLLSDSDLSMVRIATKCGFQSTEAMRVSFQRHINIAPSEFRARFRSAGNDEH